MSAKTDLEFTLVPQSCIITCADALHKKPEWRSRYDIDLIYSFLKRLPIFQSAHPFVLRELCSYVHYEYICRDVILFRHGDPGLNWYIVLSGTLHLKQSPNADSAATTKLYSGSMFGVREILTDTRHNVTVCTVDDVELLRVDRGDFLYLWHNYRLIMEQLVQVAADGDGDGENEGGEGERRIEGGDSSCDWRVAAQTQTGRLRTPIEANSEIQLNGDAFALNRSRNNVSVGNTACKTSSVHLAANGSSSTTHEDGYNANAEFCASPTNTTVSSNRYQLQGRVSSNGFGFGFAARNPAQAAETRRSRSLANDSSDSESDRTAVLALSVDAASAGCDTRLGLTAGRGRKDCVGMQRILQLFDDCSVKDRLRYYVKVLRTSLLATQESIIRDQFVHLVRNGIGNGSGNGSAESGATKTICYPQCMQGSSLFSWLRSLVESFARRVLPAVTPIADEPHSSVHRAANGHDLQTQLQVLRSFSGRFSKTTCYRTLQMLVELNLLYDVATVAAVARHSAFQNASDRFYRFACDNRGMIAACGQLERSVAECEVMLLLDALLSEADRFWCFVLLRKPPNQRSDSEVFFLAQHLRNLPAFDAISDTQLLLFARCSSAEMFKVPGTVVHSKSEAMEHFYVILSGSFCIERLCDDSFCMLQEGDCCGRRIRSVGATYCAPDVGRLQERSAIMNQEDLEARAHVIARDSYSRLLRVSVEDLVFIQKTVDDAIWRFPMDGDSSSSSNANANANASTNESRTQCVYECANCMARVCTTNHAIASRNAVLQYPLYKATAEYLLWAAVKTLGLAATAAETVAVDELPLPSLATTVVLTNSLFVSNEQLAATFSKLWDEAQAQAQAEAQAQTQEEAEAAAAAAAADAGSESESVRIGVALFLWQLGRVNPRYFGYICKQMEQRFENFVRAREYSNRDASASSSTNGNANRKLYCSGSKEAAAAAEERASELLQRLLNQSKSAKHTQLEFAVTTLKVFAYSTSTIQTCVTFETRVDASCKQILEEALSLVLGPHCHKDITNYRLYELKSNGELTQFEVEEYGIPTRLSLNGKLVVLPRSQSQKIASSMFAPEKLPASAYSLLIATKSHDLASAITAQSKLIFLEVPEVELLQHSCRDPTEVMGRDWITPHLDRLVRDFSWLRSWTQTQIALSIGGKEQIRLMRKLIKVSSVLYEMNNFHALFAIFGAMNEEPVTRVTRASLMRLSPKNVGDLKLVAAYNHLRHLVLDPHRHAYTYRLRITIDSYKASVQRGDKFITKTGFVPYIQHFLNELKRISGKLSSRVDATESIEHTTSATAQHLINVHKLNRLSQVVERFSDCKSICSSNSSCSSSNAHAHAHANANASSSAAATSDFSTARQPTSKEKEQDSVASSTRCIYSVDCIDDAKRLVECLRKQPV